MKARGNRIGSITDLKTSCLAAGRPDLAYKLVEQLQNALDSLKHRVEIDESVISEIRKEVAQAPWLKFKRERRVSESAGSLDVATPTDRAGSYNVLRKELGFCPTNLALASKNGCRLRTSADSSLAKPSPKGCSRNAIGQLDLRDAASRIVEREEEINFNSQTHRRCGMPCASARTRNNAGRQCLRRQQSAICSLEL